MSNALGGASHVMSRQLGLATRRQLIEQSLTSRQIDGLLGARVLRRIRSRVYALTGAPVTWNQAAMAAVLAGGETAVASHSSAAHLWSAKVLPDRRLEITVARPRHPVVPGVIVHSSTILTDQDVTHRFMVPCTTFERTLVDLTTVLSLMQLGRVLDDGLRRGITSLARFTDCVYRLDSGPQRRLSLAQELLAHRNTAYERAGSRREYRVYAVLEAANVRLPDQQVTVTVGERTYVLDYAYRDIKRFIEYYELAGHGTPSAVAYDSHRITDLSNVGWKPLIFTDESSDERIVSETRKALEAAADDLAQSA